jgi:hypothetical protein
MKKKVKKLIDVGCATTDIEEAEFGSFSSKEERSS